MRKRACLSCACASFINLALAQKNPLQFIKTYPTNIYEKSQAIKKPIKPVQLSLIKPNTTHWILLLNALTKGALPITAKEAPIISLGSVL